MFRVMVRIYGLPSRIRVRVTVGFRAAMSKPNDLLAQKVCHCLDQGRTLKAISMRVAHWMTNFDLSKLHLACVLIITAMVTHVIKWHWEPAATKCQIEDYQNKDRLSVCRILFLLLQRTPILSRTKTSTGSRAWHSWFKGVTRGGRGPWPFKILYNI